jgi:hydrogenase maturation protease
MAKLWTGCAGNESMARVLLIGYGNTLRGDDALGPMAVEQLRPLLARAEFEVEFEHCHQLAPELAAQLAAVDLVIFVDAAAEGRPGLVRVERLSPQADGAASLTHHVQPAALLALTIALYGRAPQAMLVSSAGANFENGEGLSEGGCAALKEICRLVPLLVRDFFASH